MSRARAKGLTLVETLVACTLMAMLGLVLFFVVRQGTAAYQKHEEHSQADRSALLAMEHLRRELMAAQVETPPLDNEAAELSLLVPRMADGQMVLDGLNQPVLDPAVIRLESGGDLVRLDGSVRRHLGNLGQLGAVRFQMESDRLMRIRVRVQREADDRSAFELTSHCYLFNQP